jgi:radical SAM superfamily enzyme YgiQ (UPF0313 family)
MKIRFIEPGNPPYKPSVFNAFIYDKYIRTPSHGLMTIATVADNYLNKNERTSDVLMYSESITKINWQDCFDADIIFITMFTYQAERGYRLGRIFKKYSNAVIVFGGLHATAIPEEAARYCDYILTGEGEESIIDFIDAVKNNEPMTFPGLKYIKNGKLISTGSRKPPENINIIPNRYLAYGYKKATKYNTIWPQVHASRGCPHNCDYCAVIRHFGRKVRTRTPENVVEDIRRAVEFHKDTFPPRLVNILWITDDNFFADRKWAVSVLKAIIRSGIKYNFTIQARYEVGFDNEMLLLLKKAGFTEIAMGIEFIDDENFNAYNKKSTRSEIIDSIRNIQAHGIRVRGLFIMGADHHKKGCGKQLADFVKNNGICGVLIQGMYFVPGTPVYEATKDRLLHKNWSKYNGNIVHMTKNISPRDMQLEIIDASRRIYSLSNVITTLFSDKKAEEKALFLGEALWHFDTRRNLFREFPLF